MIKIYYHNITSDEAQFFHGITVPNFTIKLSDALTSGLFKVETIITDKLYKIYPLFYTESISTDNEADTVIDDLCIICTKQEDKETYITCISNENEPVQDYQNYASYYDIGDQLTTAEYNAIISMLRHSVTHSDTIRIGESYNGDYGFYEFDIEDTTVLDTGILITDETITAEPKVKLSNPSFHFSTYTLQLSILHYTGVNIFDDDNTDYKVVDTLEIELEPDTWVPIPVETIEHGYIISFDAEVQIRHDKSEIHMITGLTVSGEPDIIQSGETAEVYSQLIDYGGYPYNINDASGKTIYFFERLTPTFTLTATPNPIQTGDTSDIYASVKDSDGSKIGAGTPVYFYQVEGAEPPLPTPTITLTGSNINVGETLTLTGVLSAGEDESVKIYQGETLLDTVTTGVDGAFSKTVTGLTSGSYTFKAVFEGNEEYQGATSSNLSITVSKLTPTISLTGSNITVGETLELTGVLSVGSGSSVKIYQDNVIIDTVTTSTGGAFSKNVTGLSVGQYSFKAVFDGDSTYTGVTSSIVQVTVSDVPTVLSVTSDKDVLSYADGDEAVLTATLTGGVVSGKSVVFKKGSTVLDTVQTDSSGVATYTYSSEGVGDVTLTVECMSLQETYDIEDCWNTQLSEVSAGSNTVNSIGMDTVHNVQNDDFCLIFDHKGNGNICIGATSEYSTPSTANYRLTLGSYDSKHYCAVRTNSTDESSGSSENNSTYYTYKIEKQGNTVSFYVNDVLWLTKTATFFSSYSSYSIYNIKWGGGTDYMKNIRLKPL